jgi:hypothetical protein
MRDRLTPTPEDLNMNDALPTLTAPDLARLALAWLRRFDLDSDLIHAVEQAIRARLVAVARQSSDSPGSLCDCCADRLADRLTRMDDVLMRTLGVDGAASLLWELLPEAYAGEPVYVPLSRGGRRLLA